MTPENVNVLSAIVSIGLVSGATGFICYRLGLRKGKQNVGYEQQTTVEPPDREEPGTDETYPEMSLTDMLTTGKNCMLHGRISRFYNTPDGVSGMLRSSATKIPFYYDFRDNNFAEDDGLVLVLMGHSQDNQKDCSLLGSYDKDLDIFCARYIQMSMNGKDYCV